MVVNDFKIAKFRFALKNWPKNIITFVMYILKHYQLPDLINDYVDLYAHLDHQDGFERLRSHKIRIPIEELSHKHVFYPGITRNEDKFISCWRSWG